MNIKIIAVGKIKEKYDIQAIEEYKKRLSSYCSLTIVEVPASKILSEQEKELAKYKKEEAEKILANIKNDSFVVTLEINAKQLSSEDFAKKINEVEKSGVSELVFIIGGANGLDQTVIDRSNLGLSFSKMTFTHQMARIILLEQIYRGFKILKNEPYHR